MSKIQVTAQVLARLGVSQELQERYIRLVTELALREVGYDEEQGWYAIDGMGEQQEYYGETLENVFDQFEEGVFRKNIYDEELATMKQVLSPREKLERNNDDLSDLL